MTELERLTSEVAILKERLGAVSLAVEDWESHWLPGERQNIVRLMKEINVKPRRGERDFVPEN